MKKALSLLLALAMIVACLTGISFAEEAPANAIASIETGGTTVYATTVAELVAAIDKKGESTVTLLKDVTHTATVNLPVCTLDLQGFRRRMGQRCVFQRFCDR